MTQSKKSRVPKTLRPARAGRRRWGFAVAIGFAVAMGASPVAAGETDGDLIGAEGVHRIVQSDLLVDLARRFDLGFVELAAANPEIDPWIMPAGTDLVLPTAHLLPDAPRRGVVINLAELRLYYVDPAGPVVTFPIGIGGEGRETLVGQTRIVRKRAHPTWTVPASIRAERPELPATVPPGPDNPLGDYALDLGWPSYLIHGTNKPDGVGRRVSHGCIRLYPEDIAWLYAHVPVGTPVTVVDQPVKVGWSRGRLYLEVHPTQTQADAIEAHGTFTAAPTPDLEWRVQRAAGAAAGSIDRPLMRKVAAERRGLPVRIGPTAPTSPQLAGAAPGNYFRNDLR